ncbi:MAG: ABC transporter permease [Chloroflexi bacterium]|nr:MAG: ABC transporter permease [Chloroflexota bacterium]
MTTRAGRANRILLGGLALIILASLAAPVISPYDPLAQTAESLAPPDPAHLLGADLAGRDVWSRLLHGGARTLSIAALSVALSVLPGLVLGLVAGYFGGVLDAALTALFDTLLAIPGLLVALAVVVLAGSGAAQIAVAVGLSGLASYARVVRSAVRAVLVLPYVEAARSLGAHPGGILLRHVLPNITRPLLAFAGVTLSWAIMSAAALHFLGFGGDPSAPEWGAMLAEGRQVYRAAPWVALAPGLAITVTLLLVNGLAGRLSRD